MERRPSAPAERNIDAGRALGIADIRLVPRRSDECNYGNSRRGGATYEIHTRRNGGPAASGKGRLLERRDELREIDLAGEAEALSDLEALRLHGARLIVERL